MSNDDNDEVPNDADDSDSAPPHPASEREGGRGPEDTEAEGLRARVERIVERMLAKPYQRHRINDALDLGALIMKEYFDDDPKKLRARGPKAVAVKHISAHPRCPFKPRELRVAAELHVLEVDLGEEREVLKSEHLTYSHLEIILGAPLAIRVGLLKEAASTKLDFDELLSRVRAAREGKRRGGPKPKSEFERLVAAVERAVDKLRDFVEDPENRSGLDRDALAAFVKRSAGLLSGVELRAETGAS